jgi:hypothetical protein
MASDYDNDTSVNTSEYSIELGSTTSLVFTTKNKIHLLSDSNNSPQQLRGKGYKGDFQFYTTVKIMDKLFLKRIEVLRNCAL